MKKNRKKLWVIVLIIAVFFGWDTFYFTAKGNCAGI